MNDKVQLTLQEALCVLNCGWRTNIEKELFDVANKIVVSERNKQLIKYQINNLNNQLESLNNL